MKKYPSELFEIEDEDEDLSEAASIDQAEAPEGYGDADRDFLEGQLLIAMPTMGDPRFERSVIYLCAHSEQGAMGFVINKRVDGITFEDLLDHLSITPPRLDLDPPIHFGGPVNGERGFVLHSSDYHSEDSTLAVDEEVSLTATIDILRAIAEGRGPKESMLALGYAGWAPGQLESEILANGWLHCEADPDLLFRDDNDAKWINALAKLGIDMSALSNTAGQA